MAVRIRLTRRGRKKNPFYRIVIADSESKRDGRFIEIVGTYDPMQKKDEASVVTLKKDRIDHWLKTGASPSNTVKNILKKEGLMAV